MVAHMYIVQFHIRQLIYLPWVNCVEFCYFGVYAVMFHATLCTNALVQQQNAGSLKKEFRVSVCRTIVTELKPFYQSEKFKSYVSFT